MDEYNYYFKILKVIINNKVPKENLKNFYQGRTYKPFRHKDDKIIVLKLLIYGYIYVPNFNIQYYYFDSCGLVKNVVNKNIEGLYAMFGLDFIKSFDEYVSLISHVIYHYLCLSPMYYTINDVLPPYSLKDNN